MKNKKYILILSILLSFLLIGCGNTVVKDALKQSKEAMQSKNYDKALASIEIVLDNDSQNSEALIIKSIITDYLNAKEALEENKSEKARDILQKINSQYEDYPIKDDVNTLKETVNNKIQNNEKINSNIEKLNNLVNSQKYNDAKKLAETIKSESLTNEQKKKIDSLYSEINLALKQINEKNLKKETENENNNNNKETDKKSNLPLSPSSAYKEVLKYKKSDETIGGLVGDGMLTKGHDVGEWVPQDEFYDNFYTVVVSDSQRSETGYYINKDNGNIYDRNGKKLN
ncbi:hypothetical protein I3900191A7_13000 [Clostridium baratii]|uniref:hypothetical protein n=2 Tax=Clostridium baratii TaxID=1561 RepID=UPI0036F2FE5B